MERSYKLQAFDHVVFKLCEWFAEFNNGAWEKNDLSKLKVTKLLFFTSAITASTNNPGLLDTFDQFTAMPYGHVESTIQDYMDDSLHYKITKSLTTFKEGVFEYKQPLDFNNTALEIDSAIAKLKQANNELITYDAFTLVELSHRWQSWQTVFSLAKKNGKLSMKIPSMLIMAEPKFFKLP